MDTDDMLDFALLMAVLIIGLPVWTNSCRMQLRSDIKYTTQIEKTAMVSKGESEPINFITDKNDVLLSLVIADRYTQGPKKIITPDNWALNLDDNFFSNKIPNIKTAYSNIDKDVSIKTILGVNDSGMKGWLLRYE